MGVIVPGGFGERGNQGKKRAIKYAREHNIPFFGICLGMQLAILESLESSGIVPDADSTEFNRRTPSPVISLVSEWQTAHGTTKQQTYETDKGSSMRLGSFACSLSKQSKMQAIYQSETITERHRHRYEVNPAYKQDIIRAGFTVCGVSSQNDLIEAIELRDHPWFIGVQFHPEFQSNPFDGHPLFNHFIKTIAAL